MAQQESHAVIKDAPMSSREEDYANDMVHLKMTIPVVIPWEESQA